MKCFSSPFNFFFYCFYVNSFKFKSYTPDSLSHKTITFFTQESDDEPREDKDHFVAQLYKYMEECNTPINKEPTVGNRDLDLYRLYKVSSEVCIDSSLF